MLYDVISEQYRPQGEKERKRQPAPRHSTKAISTYLQGGDSRRHLCLVPSVLSPPETFTQPAPCRLLLRRQGGPGCGLAGFCGSGAAQTKLICVWGRHNALLRALKAPQSAAEAVILPAICAPSPCPQAFAGQAVRAGELVASMRGFCCAGLLVSGLPDLRRELGEPAAADRFAAHPS